MRFFKALVSNEEEGYQILKRLDADYVALTFGGYNAHETDEIGKFFWLMRISASVHTGAHIKDDDYMSDYGQFRCDEYGKSKYHESLIYRLSYQNFGKVYNRRMNMYGFDEARKMEVYHKNISLQYFEEAYTTTNWYLRIFKLKKESNRNYFFSSMAHN
ncbi:unnamed protein product [Dracunculus medinensis]|uniref:Dolichyl-diphosphooligosaccharide--protein glycotransferase n=1 Tax=Dracunculus medinensis TaxID=318479 RepID=A0A0N4US64_DRAME|nr:unnamed protein product [Dracunculus medinensis]